MAGTAMAIPVFEGEKWRRLDSILACVIECPLRASAQIEEGLTCVSCMAVISGSSV